MPANLPPEYLEAEKKYRQAATIPEKIKFLELMLSVMPKHKGTDRLRAELRKKLARLEEEAERKLATSKRGGLQYSVKKEGAGQVALAGLPNVGKSQIVASLTTAKTEVADYPYTTKLPIPGMMKFENIQIQLIDLPPLMMEENQAWLAHILRSADLVLMVVELQDDPVGQAEILFEELEKMRIKPLLPDQNRDSDIRVWFKKVMIVGTKRDLPGAEENLRELEARFSPQFKVIGVSAVSGQGLEELRREIFYSLEVIRVYTKAPGEKPDFTEPVVLKKGSTVLDVAETIHKDFAYKLKYAQVWGSGKFSGQRVSRDHQLQDGDVVELHI